jgi:dihydroorotase
MKIIIRGAKIIDSKSPFNNQTLDILIVDGFIKKIGESLPNSENAEEVKLDNLHVSQGWFDSSVSFGEPGYEDRETIENGLNTASKSGFTAIALQPNSFPIIDNQSQVNFVLNKAHGFATQLFPIGALTKESEGKDMAELYDMKKAGAVAFGDYTKSLDNANLLKIALQYVQDFDGLVIAFAQDDNKRKRSS